MKVLKYLIFCLILLPTIRHNWKLRNKRRNKLIATEYYDAPDSWYWAYDLAYDWNYNVRIESGLMYVNELLRCKICNDVLDDDEEKYIETMCTDCCRKINYESPECKGCCQRALCGDPDFDKEFSKHSEGYNDRS